MAKILDSKIPEGPVAEKWTNFKAHQRLVNPKNKLKLDVIVVGTGLAGASAAASLGEMGFTVYNFCIQDSPRRAHSIAAQGGINAAKNYQNDGDSVYRLFYDTVKGGDYRAREANVYRLAEVSNSIIDQCVAQGVPFAREYGGMLANRSFGGAQVSRTFYAKGQTGQQLLLGAYSALSKQVHDGRVKLYTRYEMEDVVIVDEHARGIIAKNLVTGKLERFSANAVVIATGGYGADFRAFLIILIMAFFNIYTFQVAGFFVRRVVLQDKEYSYGRSFEEFGRLSVYTLPISLFAFLVGLVKAYEFYGFLNFLIFFLYTVGTLYVVYQALNNTKFKADKFILLVASIAILIVFAGLVVYLDRQILEQAIMGSIPNTPNFGDLGNFGY